MAGAIAKAYVELLVDDSKLSSGAKGSFGKIERAGKSASEGIEQDFKKAGDGIEAEMEEAARATESAFDNIDPGGGLLSKFTGAGSQAGGSFIGAFSPALLAGGGVAAVGAGAALALNKGFQGYMDAENITAGFEASLGLTEEEAARAGRISGDLFAGGWGEAKTDTASAVEAVLAEFGDLNDADLLALSTNVLAVSEAMDIDVASAAATAGIAVREGLANTGLEAIDDLAFGLQEMPVQFRDELLEATNEYGTFFSALGIEGDAAFQLLSEAAEGGVYGIDKTGDAIKELTIRATDGSEGSVVAFKNIGLNADEMAAKILAGGDEANEGFNQIIDGLLAVEDPAAQSQAAIALFGTPLEDLGTGEIPDFLQSLSDMDSGLEDTGGTATDMADTLSGTTSEKMQQLQRGAMALLTKGFTEHIVPAIETTVAWFEDSLIPTMQDLWTTWEPLINIVITQFEFMWEKIQIVFNLIITVVEVFFDILTGKWGDAWEGIKEAFFLVWDLIVLEIQRIWTLITELIGLALETVWNLITEALSAVWQWLQDTWDDILQSVKDVWNDIVSWIQEAWNTIYDNTIGKVIELYDKIVEWFGKLSGWWSDTWDDIKQKAADIWNAIYDNTVGKVTELYNKVVEWVGKLSTWWSDTWNTIKTAVTGVWDGISTFISDTWDDITGFVETGVDGVVGFFTGLPERISSAVAGAFDSLWTGFKSVLNLVIGGWNNLKLPGFSFGGWEIGKGPFKFTAPTLTVPDFDPFPYISPLALANGGVVRSPTLALIGESGPEVVSPLNRQRSDFLPGGGGDGAVVSIANANFYDGTDADLVAQKTMLALSARRLTA